MIDYDLRPDAVSIRSYMEKRVLGFTQQTNDGPGPKNAAVSLIQVGFDHEQTGYVALVFDTRPNADTDGEWTMHLESETNCLELPKWAAITGNACINSDAGLTEDARIRFTNLDGSTTLFDWNAGDSYQYAAIFGKVIRDVVLASRDNGLFDRLPIADDCRICIEMISGLYVWPSTDGVVEPASRDNAG